MYYKTIPIGKSLTKLIVFFDWHKFFLRHFLFFIVVLSLFLDFFFVPLYFIKARYCDKKILIMNKLKLHLSISALIVALLGCATAWGQNPETGRRSLPLTLKGYGFYDCHLATGGFGGGALLLDWQVAPAFTLGGGIEYASLNRVSARLSGEATLLTTRKGCRLTIENSYLWRQYPDWDRQEFTSALQLGWNAHHAVLHLGLCNRYTADLIQRTDGGAATICEPMNVMFAVEGWWMDEANEVVSPMFNIGLRWSNYNDFVIERVANWFFSLKGYYTLPDGTSLTAEVGTHPVGSLNLTASYDGWFCHLGAMRRF